MRVQKLIIAVLSSITVLFSIPAIAEMASMVCVVNKTAYPLVIQNIQNHYDDASVTGVNFGNNLQIPANSNLKHCYIMVNGSSSVAPRGVGVSFEIHYISTLDGANYKLLIVSYKDPAVGPPSSIIHYKNTLIVTESTIATPLASHPTDEILEAVLSIFRFFSCI